MATKLDYMRRNFSRRIDEIRESISFVGDAVVGLGKKNANYILHFLIRMDEIAAFFQLCEAETPELDLTPEKLKFGTTYSRLTRDAAAVLKALGGKAVLRQARPAHATRADHPWWFIDVVLERQKADRWKMTLWLTGLVAGLFLLALAVIHLVIQPDLSSMHMVRHFDTAIELIRTEDDYGAALTEADEALKLMPYDIKMLVLRSVILEQLGQPANAAKSYRTAFASAEKPERVPLLKGQVLAELGDFENALAASEQAIDLNPSYAEAWLQVGQMYDRLDRVPQAFDAMLIASELADEQENYTLDGIIRFNLENLANSARRE